MIDRCGPVDANSAGLKLGGKIVEKLVGAVNRLLRPPSPKATHIAVFRDFGVKRGFFRRDVAVVSAPDDYVA